jgi:hypothetical protein
LVRGQHRVANEAEGDHLIALVALTHRQLVAAVGELPADRSGVRRGERFAERGLQDLANGNVSGCGLRLAVVSERYQLQTLAAVSEDIA